MGRNPRRVGTAWKEFVQTPVGTIALGETIRKGLD